MNTELKPTIKKVGDIYVLPRGDKLSCQEMAELEIEVIAHIQNQIKSTRDARKKKRLQEKLRNVKLWIAMHPDIGKFMH